ncbi:MAG: ferrous iron transport protein A [Planctomycetes bacterium]|nr:ferrous iron transport protein A [Planctomycetota bacterium]
MTTECDLGSLAPGESAEVVRVDGSDALAGRLHAHGIWPGTTISVVRRAPMGGPMQLSLQGFRLALRLGEAKRVVCRRIAAT